MIEPERNAARPSLPNAWPGLAPIESEKSACRARLRSIREAMDAAYLSFCMWSDCGAAMVGPERATFHAGKRFAEWCEEAVRYWEAVLELAKGGKA